MSAGHVEAAFRRQVDRWVQDGLEAGADSFDDLVGRLPGVYPTVAADSLDRLLRNGQILPTQHATGSRRDQAAPQPRRRPPPVLPPPHPLDFDWRYTPDTVDELIQHAVRATEPGDEIVLLGTPSLYLAAMHQRLDRRFVLIDTGNPTVTRLASIGESDALYERNLFHDDPPDLHAAAVVADPPWYAEHIDAFLWTAATSARPGARVFMSLPAIGTRPGGRQERIKFREMAKTHGMRTVGTLVNSLTYQSPPFEVNALLAAGWENLPVDWRRGDLVVLTASGRPQRRPEAPHTDARWAERSLGWARVRVRAAGGAEDVDPTLQQMIDGDVLDDVSRHHPLRERVTVWTSGNRVYGCADPKTLLAVLDAAATGDNARERVETMLNRSLSHEERAKVARAMGQVRWLARVEGRELSRLGWTARARLTERIAS